MTQTLEEMLTIRTPKRTRSRSARPRDSQRQKVYDAEDAIHGKDLPTVPEMQEYIDAILRKRWFKNRYPNIKQVKVQDGRGRRRAVGIYRWTYSIIKMPRWARCEMVLLHELAHVVTDGRKGVFGASKHAVASHGPEFARNFLDLVYWKMGREAGDTLRASFKEKRVKLHRRSSNG